MYIKKFVNILLLLSSMLITFLTGLTHYDSTNSPDFGRYYYSYSSYFTGASSQTGLEQGNLYYFLVSKSISTGSNLVLDFYMSEYLNYKIQLINFTLFSIGLLFVYFYLKEIGISFQLNLLCLISLNFFLPLFSLRLIYKPEIFLFLLFCISLYLIEKNFNTNGTIYLYLLSLCAAIMLSTKLVSAAILLFYLFLHFIYKSKYIFVENYKKMILLFVVFFSIFSYENYLINGVWFFDHNTPPEYSNKADLNFLFNFELNRLLFTPYQHNVSDSALSIILLETFDDYYHLYWNNDKSLFNLGQLKFGNLQFIVQYIGIGITSIFYCLIIFFSIFHKKNRLYLLSPFIGIFVMLAVSLFIQFNPDTGDQIKNYYYATLLAFTFVHLFLILNKYINFKYLIIFLILQAFITSYIVGFPKEYSENMELKIVDQIIPTKFCKAYKNFVDFPVYESPIEKDCINEQTFCRVSLSYNLSPEFRGGEFYIKFDKPLKRIDLQKNAKILSVNEINDCINKVNLGYTFTNKTFEIKNPIPIFSVTLFIFLLFSVVLKEFFRFFIIRRKKIEK
tara:strand:- start:11865 stop:13550 length:1686 start_codon:yes stop_codon:yes gene_type:complete